MIILFFIEELPQDVVSFPQADSFSKVISTLELIANGFNSASDVFVRIRV